MTFLPILKMEYGIYIERNIILLKLSLIIKKRPLCQYRKTYIHAQGEFKSRFATIAQSLKEFKARFTIFLSKQICKCTAAQNRNLFGMSHRRWISIWRSNVFWTQVGALVCNRLNLMRYIVETSRQVGKGVLGGLTAVSEAVL